MEAAELKKNDYELPPMRSIKQAMAEIKETDPDTQLSEWALRKMVVDGTIPSVRVGTKYLINMKVLQEYMYQGTPVAKEEHIYRGIRMVKE